MLGRFKINSVPLAKVVFLTLAIDDEDVRVFRGRIHATARSTAEGCLNLFIFLLKLLKLHSSGKDIVKRTNGHR